MPLRPIRDKREYHAAVNEAEVLTRGYELKRAA